MSLEKIINQSNTFYNENNIALIYKKPTPIKVVKMNQKTGEIISAFFEQKSTTDYNGIYKGKYIDFEAKTTKSTTSLSFDNYRENQLKHFKKVIAQGGLAFTIILFSALNEYYFIDMKIILKMMDENKKSIKLRDIKNKGHIVPLSLNPYLNYLKIIDDFYS